MIEEFSIGNSVVCDDCSKDYTHSTEQGGILFESKGICPVCAPKWLRAAKAYHEEHFVRGRAKEGEEFRAFIMRIRGGNNTVRVSGSDDFVKQMVVIIKGVNREAK